MTAPGEAAVWDVVRRAGRPVTPRMQACFERLDPASPIGYRGLAALLASDWSTSRPRRVGLAGGQGAGKSTLAGLVESAGADFGLRVAVLGLDDFYLPLAERRALAARVHPLLETRGPPGTHDVPALAEALRLLTQDVEVELPVFDKGRDDRVGTRRLRGPFDVTLLEGWCVGAEPASPASLEEPVNELERCEDADGVWRRHVNEALAGDYARLWRRLDQLVYLRVPDLDAVRRWRLQQEGALPPARRSSADQIARFVGHYERITRAMFASMPERADLTVFLAPDHGVERLVYRSPKGR